MSGIETEVCGKRGLPGAQLVVHRSRLRDLLMIRKFARDHGYEIVDARWRRWDKWFMIFSIAVFGLSGNVLVLAVALCSGLDWARSFPREELR